MEWHQKEILFILDTSYQYFSKGMQGTDITVQQHCPFTNTCSLGPHTLPYIYEYARTLRAWEPINITYRVHKRCS